MASRVDFKQRYRHRWPDSVLRERFVLLFLKVFLPQGFEARLVGFGAGNPEYVEGRFHGLEDAIDIAVFFQGDPIALIDVTGVTHRSVKKKGLGYCVGGWKLFGKAEKYGVLDRMWIAFVLEGETRILWAPATKFLTEYAIPGKLYEDEDDVRCLPAHKWHPWYNPKWEEKGPIPFLVWLRQKAAEGPTKPLLRAFKRKRGPVRG